MEPKLIIKLITKGRSQGVAHPAALRTARAGLAVAPRHGARTERTQSKVNKELCIQYTYVHGLYNTQKMT